MVSTHSGNACILRHRLEVTSWRSFIYIQQELSRTVCNDQGLNRVFSWRFTGGKILNNRLLFSLLFSGNFAGDKTVMEGNKVVIRGDPLPSLGKTPLISSGTARGNLVSEQLMKRIFSKNYFHEFCHQNVFLFLKTFEFRQELWENTFTIFRQNFSVACGQHCAHLYPRVLLFSIQIFRK